MKKISVLVVMVACLLTFTSARAETYNYNLNLTLGANTVASCLLGVKEGGSNIDVITNCQGQCSGTNDMAASSLYIHCPAVVIGRIIGKIFWADINTQKHTKKVSCYIAKTSSTCSNEDCVNLSCTLTEE